MLLEIAPTNCSQRGSFRVSCAQHAMCCSIRQPIVVAFVDCALDEIPHITPKELCEPGKITIARYATLYIYIVMQVSGNLEL